MSLWKWWDLAWSNMKSLSLSRKYSDAATKKPEVPQAGSHITSSEFGFTRFTIIFIMCLGVRNCPLVPDVCNFDKRYSYMSPLMSLSSVGSSSMAVTTFCKVCGLLIWKFASFMYLEKDVSPSSPCRFFIKGKISPCMSWYISVADPRFLKTCHL